MSQENKFKPKIQGGKSKCKNYHSYIGICHNRHRNIDTALAVIGSFATLQEQATRLPLIFYALKMVRLPSIGM